VKDNSQSFKKNSLNYKTPPTTVGCVCVGE